MREPIDVLATCFAATLLSFVGCSSQDGQPTDLGERCAELADAVERCYPGAAEGLVCTAQTIGPYDGVDFATASCSALEDAGKADYWGSDDGSIDFEALADLGYWPAEEAAWRAIQPIVTAFQSDAPADALADLEALLDDRDGGAASVTFEQDVDDGLGQGPRPMAVEISQGRIALPLEEFLARLPADQWGTSLAHYVGGEVTRVDDGPTTRQVERMVLSQLPLDVDMPCLNADMTKLEVIVSGEDAVTVYWQVVYSDNGSTESDVGSVSFSRGGASETLVTFHSAHRLRAAFGIPIPTLAARLALGPFFEDHINHYRDIVTGL